MATPAAGCLAFPPHSPGDVAGPRGLPGLQSLGFAQGL